MPQRRERRCSFSAAIASFSSTLRSQRPSSSVILGSQVENLAVALLYPQANKRRAAARPAYASYGRGCVRRAVRRAYQIASFEVEEFAFAPIQLHRHVTAAIQVCAHFAEIAQHECRRRLAEVFDRKAHRLAGIDKVVRNTDQPFFCSHCLSSHTVLRQASGSSASSARIECAPEHTPIAGTPA